MKMEKWQDKCWGRTRCLAFHSYTSSHELETIAGGFCSFHYHYGRENQFEVDKGKVRVVCAYGWELEEHVLTPSSPTLSVPANVPHQFQVLESGRVFEKYIIGRPGARVVLEDIIRLTKGANVDPRVLETEVGIFLEDGSIWNGKRIDGFHTSAGC